MADFASILQMLWAGQNRFTDRKWRLFACGCARRTAGASRSPLRDVLDIVERYADGEASAHELAAARFGFRFRSDSPASLLAWMPEMPAWDMVSRLLRWMAGEDPALVMQAVPLVLADLFGPEPIRVPAMTLAWEHSMVPRLARGIYDDRAWDCLPILGDALEEAGCLDEGLLRHCREPGEHARGCWAVDSLLGKR